MTISAVIAAGVHLFPFRTEKLSPPAPMVLGGQPPGRVGRRRISFAKPATAGFARFGANPAHLLRRARSDSHFSKDGGGGAAEPRLSRGVEYASRLSGAELFAPGGIDRPQPPHPFSDRWMRHEEHREPFFGEGV